MSEWYAIGAIGILMMLWGLTPRATRLWRKLREVE